MASRDRASEILEIKSRGQRHAILLHRQLRSLVESWDDFPQKDSEAAAFFPIRAVTLLEVFTRAWIATFVDVGVPYVQRAIEFSKNLKLDFELVREIQGKTITLGDVIGHSLSLNNFGQIASALETLTGENQFMSRTLKVMHEFVATMTGAPWEPFISDVDSIPATIDKLFRVRHILVHEYPKHPVYSFEETRLSLGATSDFAQALHEVCTETLYGKLPTSEVGWKEAAAKEWDNVEQKLNGVLEELSAREDDHGRKLFSAAQSCWIAFRDAQCAFRADSGRGGTMAGLLALYEGRDLTEARLKQMQWYLTRDDGDL